VNEPKPPWRALLVARATAELAWLRPALAEAGLSVTALSHGETALDQIAADPPDLVLLGVEIDGLEAFEVCRRLTGEPHTAHLPVLMVAPAADEALLQRALSAGARRLLSPPESRRTLTLELLSALRPKQVFEAWRAGSEEHHQRAAARDALVRVSLADLEVMLGAARRALQLLAEGPPAADQRRLLRAAGEELVSADDTLATLAAVRALDAGEWRFEPHPTDLSQLLESVAAAAGGEAVVTGAADPGLSLVADGELLQLALSALVRHAAAGLATVEAVELRASARRPAGVRLEVAALGAPAAGDAPKPLAQALWLTLARLVAEGHGGALSSEPGRLVLELPPEPAPGAWPPAGRLSRAARVAAGPTPAAAATAADWLGWRTSLPAPPRPPRLLGPAKD
jgi:DNA-binding response OmpR family regulator